MGLLSNVLKNSGNKHTCKVHSIFILNYKNIYVHFLLKFSQVLIQGYSSWIYLSTARLPSTITMKEKDKRSNGYSITYFSAKSCLLVAYYNVLERFTLHTIDFNFQSFISFWPPWCSFGTSISFKIRRIWQGSPTSSSKISFMRPFASIFIPVLVGVHLHGFPGIFVRSVSIFSSIFSVPLLDT